MMLCDLDLIVEREKPEGDIKQYGLKNDYARDINTDESIKKTIDSLTQQNEFLQTQLAKLIDVALNGKKG